MRAPLPTNCGAVSDHRGEQKPKAMSGVADLSAEFWAFLPTLQRVSLLSQCILLIVAFVAAWVAYVHIKRVQQLELLKIS
jgi:hypothetical protein